MLYSIYFDVAALALLMFLIFSAAYREMIFGLANRIFLLILILGFVSTALDVVLAVPTIPKLISLTLANVHYSVMAAILPSITMLIMTQARMRRIFTVPAQLAFVGPYLLFLLAVWVINPILEWDYAVEGKYLFGGFLGWSLIITAFVYLIYSACIMFKYSKNIEKNILINMIAILPTVGVALWLEWLARDVALFAFIFSINALVYTESVRRPEATVDIETGLNKLDVFMREMKLTLLSRQKATAFIIKIENYNRLRSNLSTEGTIRLSRAIADGMRDTLRVTGRFIETYYLEQGMFAFTLTEGRRDKLEFLIRNAEKCVFAKLEKVQRLSVVPSFYTCIVDFPEDIGDYHSIMPFLRAFEEIVPRAGKIFRLSELKNKGDAGLYMNIGSILQRAIARGEISVYFTPIFSEPRQCIAAAEAECMLMDQRYGSIDPKLCLVTAEATGCAEKLMDIVFDNVCRFIASASFKEAKLEFVTVKLSVKCLADQYACDNFLRQVKKYGIKPENIVFEITETAAEDDWNEVLAQVRLLRFSGFGIALNDYGQSNSNIKRLLAFPLTHVKIDGALMRSAEREVPLSSSDGTNFLSPWEVIMNSTVEMMEKLRLRIIADGVDDAQSVLHASEMGCEYMQGLNFGYPMAQNAFFRKLEENSQETD